MAKFFLLLLEKEVKANPCFSLNNVEFGLLPNILHMPIANSKP